MTTFLANAAWPACISALRLDRWMAGELGPAEAEEVRAHVAGCARCTSAVKSLAAARDEVRLPPLLTLPAPARRAVRLRAIAVLAGGLAAAAGLLLVFRPGAPTDRTKGAGVGLGMYALHGDAVRQIGPGEVVAPGDAVRFSVTTPEAAYVAVLSVDPAGRASIYFPAGLRAAPVSAGRDMPLPLATRLDSTAGEERVIGLFCDRPVELEPLRLELEAGASGGIPEGCRVTRWNFVKR
jgi:anti-sigma factor RsiW